MENHTKIYRKLSALNNSDSLYVSVLSLYEMEYSILNGNPAHQVFFRATLKKIREDFQVVPVTEKGAYFYGEFKTFLRNTMNINRENIKKHNIDIMLASTARAGDYVLVSADTIFAACAEIWQDFKFQNWLG